MNQKSIYALAGCMFAIGCGGVDPHQETGESADDLSGGSAYWGAWQWDDCGGNSNDVPNSVANSGFACPSGVPAQTSGRILGPESRCGVTQFECSATSGTFPPRFGGMYQVTDPCPPGGCFTGMTANPTTGAASCPTGYSAKWMGRVLQPEEGRGANQYVCVLNDIFAPVKWLYGGVFQRDDCGQVHINNAQTGGLSCPAGFTAGRYGRVKVPEGAQCGANQFVCIKKL